MGIVVDVEREEFEALTDRLNQLELLLQIVLYRLDPEAARLWHKAMELDIQAQNFPYQETRSAFRQQYLELIDRLLPIKEG